MTVRENHTGVFSPCIHPPPICQEARPARGRGQTILGRLRRPWTGVLQLLTAMLWIFQPAAFIGGGESIANGYKLTVWAGPDTVDAGGQTVIYAQLVESETNIPVAGAMLNFSAPTGDGTLATTSLITEPDGLCAVGFVAGSNSTQVNVWDGMGYEVSTSCVISVNPAPPPPPSYQLWIGANKNPLQQLEATTLRVQLTEAGTGAAVGGATINFQVAPGGNATLGALSATTDLNGRCEVPVTAGSIPSQVNAWDVSGYNASNGLTLMVPTSGDTLSLTLSPGQNPLTPGDTTNITARVMDTTVNLPMSDVSLNLWLEPQGGGGLLGGGSSASGATDGDGTCVISFQGGPHPVVVHAADASGLGLSQALTMGVSVDPYTLGLSASQSTLQPGQSATLSAQLWNVTLDAPVSGTAVNFSVDSGGDGLLSTDGTTFLQSVSATTDASGNCAVTFRGGNLTSSVSVADAGGCNTFESYTFGVFTVNATRNLSLSADDNVVLSGDYLPLRAQLWDLITGLPVSGGTVTFQVVSGGDGTLGSPGPDLLQAVTATTDAYGNCAVTFTGGSQPSTITASSVGVASPASYDFGVVAEEYSLILTPDATSIEPGDETTVNARLLNITRNAWVTGAPISFLVDPGDGTVNPANGTTDGNGDCFITFTGGSLPSTLSAWDDWGLASATLNFQVAASYALTLSANPTALTPGSATTIHALLMDKSTSPPSPLSNVTINFSASSGSGRGTVESAATTDFSGKCAVTFTGGTLPTTVSASDGTYGTSASCDFSVSATPVYALSSLSPVNPWLTAGSSTTISTTLTDTGTGAAVPDAPVTFSVLEGGDGRLRDNAGNSTMTVTANTDSGGVATVTFIFGDATTVVSAATESTYNGYTSYTFLGPSCSCPYKLAGTCTCVDFNGCTGGCHDPVACSCQYTMGSGPACTCANANGCTGGCQMPPPACGCPYTIGANPACTCPNANGCTGGCLDPPACSCQYTIGLTPTCSCANANGCTGGCQSPPPACECQYATASTPTCICLNATGCNGGCKDPPPCGCGPKPCGCPLGVQCDPANVCNQCLCPSKIAGTCVCANGPACLYTCPSTPKCTCTGGPCGVCTFPNQCGGVADNCQQDPPPDGGEDPCICGCGDTNCRGGAGGATCPKTSLGMSLSPEWTTLRFGASSCRNGKAINAQVQAHLAQLPEETAPPAPVPIGSVNITPGPGGGASLNVPWSSISRWVDRFTAEGTDSAGVAYSASVTLPPVDLAIDANRDGTIAQGEIASQEKPFRFWINNDDDPNTLGEDVETAMKKDEVRSGEFYFTPDWQTPTAGAKGMIDGVRDLEDFTRLHLSLPPDIVAKAKAGEAQIGFKWTNGSGPKINIYKAESDSGDAKFLFYKFEANRQCETSYREALLGVKDTTPAFLPSSYWQGVPSSASKLFFVFEGCARGAAKLSVVIKFGSSQETEGPGVWMKLMDVQEMFQRGKVRAPMAEPGNVPDPWVTTEPLTFESTSDPNGNDFQPDPDETKQYIIHVHGWRMSYGEAQTWANTTFKRLWQLGYKGRFALFAWPTFSGATSAADGYLTYNTSEYRAWLSGAALKSYVASLPSGYTKNIMAHSMGNVVVGSAFCHEMAGVSHYALFNAAMAAQAYDPSQISIPNLSTPDTDDDASVRSRFGLSGKFSRITAKVTNFYLEDDFATKIWSDNHALNKPNRLTDRVYDYSNSPFDIDGHGTLHKLIRHDLLSNHGVTMTEEAMAFVTRTQSLPAGRSPTNLGFTGGWQIDMNTFVFENTYRSLFGSEHSAEWIWSLQRTFGVWRALLNSFEIMPNPVP